MFSFPFSTSTRLLKTQWMPLQIKDDSSCYMEVPQEEGEKEYDTDEGKGSETVSPNKLTGTFLEVTMAQKYLRYSFAGISQSR